MFRNNTLITTINRTLNESRAFGTLSFFGSQLVINNSIFEFNINNEGSGLYIDGGANLYTITTMIINSYFDSNVAVSGAGIYLGSNIWKIKALLKNLYCSNNNAYGST